MRPDRPNRRSVTALLLVLVLVLSNLALLPGAIVAADGPVALEGTDWQLTELVTDGALMPVADGVAASMLLGDGAASGTAGCNQWFAAYTVDGTGLAFEAPGSTRMLCPEPGATVEAAFLADLALVASWQIEGDVLTLLDATAAPVLAFVAGAASPVVGA